MIHPAEKICFRRGSGRLDEITANLDAETELTVLHALSRAAANRTVLSISHRLYEEEGNREIRIS